jgi:nitrogen regulatory protein PII
MIKIEAIIRSSKFSELQETLAKINVPTFSSYQVQISGIHRVHEGVRNKTSDLIPKVKVEILCADENEEKIVDAIQKSTTAGEKGDGIIFSYNIDKLIKIRNGSSGIEAL